MIAQLLVTEGFSTIEEVAFVPMEELATIEGFDEELASELHNRGQQFLENKEVELTEEVDESIIGGAIIRIGDKQIDASLSSEISELRQMFNKNLYLQDF